MKYFTSDQHFGDHRIGINGGIDLFNRSKLFASVLEQNEYLIKCINKVVGEDDELIHLGDVCYDDDFAVLDGIKCKKRTLIKGNYDVGKESYLEKYFDEIYDFGWFEVTGILHPVFCDHYPVNCKKYLERNIDEKITLTGHIHGLWQVQEGMLNVGCDAWHFFPVSEGEILFRYNAMIKHYDDNVFVYRKKIENGKFK